MHLPKKTFIKIAFLALFVSATLSGESSHASLTEEARAHATLHTERLSTEEQRIHANEILERHVTRRQKIEALTAYLSPLGYTPHDASSQEGKTAKRLLMNEPYTLDSILEALGLPDLSLPTFQTPVRRHHVGTFPTGTPLPPYPSTRPTPTTVQRAEGNRIFQDALNNPPRLVFSDDEPVSPVTGSAPDSAQRPTGFLSGILSFGGRSSLNPVEQHDRDDRDARDACLAEIRQRESRISRQKRDSEPLTQAASEFEKRVEAATRALRGKLDKTIQRKTSKESSLSERNKEIQKTTEQAARKQQFLMASRIEEDIEFLEAEIKDLNEEIKKVESTVQQKIVEEALQEEKEKEARQERGWINRIEDKYKNSTKREARILQLEKKKERHLKTQAEKQRAEAAFAERNRILQGELEAAKEAHEADLSSLKKSSNYIQFFSDLESHRTALKAKITKRGAEVSRDSAISKQKEEERLKGESPIPYNLRILNVTLAGLEEQIEHIRFQIQRLRKAAPATPNLTELEKKELTLLQRLHTASQGLKKSVPALLLSAINGDKK